MRAKYDANGNFVLSLRDKDKNEIDAELTAMHEAKLEDIASRYKAGGLMYLEKYNKELFAEIQAAEGNLNLVWVRTMEGKATVDLFKEALCRWHETQTKGIEKYKSGLLNK